MKTNSEPLGIKLLHPDFLFFFFKGDDLDDEDSFHAQSKFLLYSAVSFLISRVIKPPN